MRLSHATMLAFVGWYLMMPPMASDLRPECSPGTPVSISDLFSSFLKGTSPRELRIRRCDRLSHEVDSYAPMASWPDSMSTWRKLGQYDTLLECDSKYRDNQTAKTQARTVGQTAASELVAEGQTPPLSEAILERRISEIEKGVTDQIEGERCIASDPNLARD
jgi:hypothetical protein